MQLARARLIFRWQQALSSANAGKHTAEVERQNQLCLEMSKQEQQMLLACETALKQSGRLVNAVTAKEAAVRCEWHLSILFLRK